MLVRASAKGLVTEGVWDFDVNWNDDAKKLRDGYGDIRETGERVWERKGPGDTS